MYLLVFTTLMIAIVGMYTQVLGLQAARFASGQSAAGSAMLQWHAAAVSMAASIIKTHAGVIAGKYPGLPVTGPGAVGCSLTGYPPPNIPFAAAGFTVCPSPVFFGVPAIAQNGTVTTGGGVPTLNLIAVPDAAPLVTGLNQCVNLAAKCTKPSAYSGNCTVSATSPSCGCTPAFCSSSFDIDYHQFYSVLYRDPTTNQDFVVTYVPAPIPTPANPPPGYVSLVPVPGFVGGNLGLSVSDVLRQLNNAGAPNYSYGTFQGFPGTAVAPPQLATTGNVYNLPFGVAGGGFQNLCLGSAACTANGSAAVIGTPDGF
jgi:hypothetical protein